MIEPMGQKDIANSVYKLLSINSGWFLSWHQILVQVLKSRSMPGLVINLRVSEVLFSPPW